jgi:hypothetical protein
MEKSWRFVDQGFVREAPNIPALPRGGAKRNAKDQIVQSPVNERK